MAGLRPSGASSPSRRSNGQRLLWVPQERLREATLTVYSGPGFNMAVNPIGVEKVRAGEKVKVVEVLDGLKIRVGKI